MSEHVHGLGDPVHDGDPNGEYTGYLRVKIDPSAREKPWEEVARFFELEVDCAAHDMKKGLRAALKAWHDGDPKYWEKAS